MNSFQLTLTPMFERAERLYAKKEIASRTASGMFRYTYGDFARRTRSLSSSMQKLGVKPGDRVATFAWNDHRHLEAYFAIPCMGAVLHTVNLRLPSEQLVYILNHAEDRFLLLEESLLPNIERIQDQLKTIEGFIIMTDKMNLPATTLKNVYSYEKLVGSGNPEFAYKEDLLESAPAGMCYTSATTGKPKGVTYTHRSIYLHSLSLGLADTFAFSERDSVLPVVPMFHVNAWGLPFACVYFGCKQVLPGPAPTPEVLVRLIEEERVTVAAGVPTVWTAVLHILEAEGSSRSLSSIRALLCGGSAAPRSLIEAFQYRYLIPFYHAYGMTETSPVATIARPKSYQESLLKEELLEICSTQGLPVPGLEMKVVGPNGEVTWNGQEMGELLLRGPWIAEEYYQDERTQESFQDGWLHTGDIAVVDQEGFVKLVDRFNDLIKSGGEWISSVDLENALMAHPSVLEACVVGIPHPKWIERPLAFVVLLNPAPQPADPEALLAFLAPKFPRWQLPDNIVYVPEIPKTSVGKFLKRQLREQYQAHYQDRDK